MALVDPADMKLNLAERRALKLRLHQSDFLRACARKAAAFRDRSSVPVSHKHAKPHRTARRAARSAIAQSQIEQASDLPTVSYGRVGLRKPAVVSRVSCKIRRCNAASDADTTASEGSHSDNDCADSLSAEAAGASNETSDLVSVSYGRVGLRKPGCKIGRSSAASDADTTASEESHSDNVCADSLSAEAAGSSNETSTSDTAESEASASNCKVVVLQDACTDHTVLDKNHGVVPTQDDHHRATDFREKKHETNQLRQQTREDVLRNIVAHLQVQRAASEEQAASLRKVLSESASRCDAAHAQLSLKQAKLMEQQRSRKTHKHVRQLRQHEQQKKGEMEAVRREAERQAKEITSLAMEQADAIRAVAQEKELQTQRFVAQESVVLQELQDSIELKRCQLLDLDHRERQVIENLETEQSRAASRLQLAQSKLADVITTQAKIEAESRKATAELESILQAKEIAEARLKQAELKPDAGESCTVSGICSEKLQVCRARAAPAQTLKNAKELERQRTLKLNKQAAHQRTLKKQKDAEMCKIREEVEREKAELLAAAECELSAMKARVKNQAQALRQKRRRSSREGLAESLAQASAPQTPVPLDYFETSTISKDEITGPARSECGTPSQEPAVELIAASVEVEAHADAVQVEEEVHPDTAEDDWEVLSQESEADETVWDLV